MENHILEFDSVSFGYDDGRPILEKVSFTAPRGGFLLIKGPSGAGKSTLLRLCCRLEEPQEGRILFDSVNIAELPPPVLRRNVCYVQQTPTLAPGSIGENLFLPFTYKSWRDTSPPPEAAVRDLLDEFRLSEFALEDSAMKLSVGQKQRVCLIRTLLMGPEIMLLDEPTSALDPESAGIVLDRALAVNRERRLTILMVTHGKVDLAHSATNTLEIAERKVVRR